MLRVFFVLLLAQLCAGTPSGRSPLSKSVECAVCQFLGATTANRLRTLRTDSLAHCLKFEECKEEKSDCEIITILYSEFEKLGGKFENAKPMIRASAEKCAKDPLARVISEDPSSTQCMMCFLVYDVLKYINYNILDNPMLDTVKGAISTACDIFLNDNLCQALFYPDTFGAIIRGLKDSLGSFYDLIAVDGFGCPAFTDLFGKC